MQGEGKLIAKDTLQFERIFLGTIEQVWEYLIDPKKRGKWFSKGTRGQKVGDEMIFIFSNSKLGTHPEPTPEKYKEFGDGFESKALITKWNKPNLLEIEWEGVVTFQLEQQKEKVKLTLTHEKLQDSKEARIGTLAGWHTHLDLLVDYLIGKETKGFWSVQLVREEEYAAKMD